MRATLRISCTVCGSLGTMVISATPEVIAVTAEEVKGTYYGHDPQDCGGTVTVARKNHKLRARKAVLA